MPKMIPLRWKRMQFSEKSGENIHFTEKYKRMNFSIHLRNGFSTLLVTLSCFFIENSSKTIKRMQLS
jgi:hypothetical protein